MIFNGLPYRDHSVVFESASKYCISDSFVDHDGYSISSKGLLPTVYLKHFLEIAKFIEKFPGDRY